MDFTQDEMTITLDSSFVKSDAKGYTGCFTSLASDVTVYALREGFDLFEEADKLTASDYAELVLANNGRDDELEAKDGYSSFSFTKTDNDVEHTYFVCLYKGGEAFWMLQFICPSAFYESMKPSFTAWADSVVFQKA